VVFITISGRDKLQQKSASAKIFTTKVSENGKEKVVILRKNVEGWKKVVGVDTVVW
jgi:hypothetical protein